MTPSQRPELLKLDSPPRPKSRGVAHPPEADIQNIRDLLRGGYESEASLFKEMIQNAEDAEARRLDLFYSPGDEGAPHPLLRTPGLCAVNDGNFSESDLDAIFRLGLGTKGANPRAIGRFGKGLKAVFAYCEAFFVLARTDPSAGWNRPTVCEFFNPWKEWRHGDWDDAYETNAAGIFDWIERHVIGTGPNSRWLAFWLPLRHPAQKCDPRGAVDWIFQSAQKRLPGEDTGLVARLTGEFRKLAPSLVMLRNLEALRVIDNTAASPVQAQWQLHCKSTRCCAAGAPAGPLRFAGRMEIAGTPAAAWNYLGISGTLMADRIRQIKDRVDWPTVVNISSSGSSAGEKAKGEPHYAACLTTEPSAAGELELRWLVFFPVSEQPDGCCVAPLRHLRFKLTLNLHGFFFLDSERRRIDGLQQQFTNTDNACLEWNAAVASEGTLAQIPSVLGGFAADQQLDSAACRDLVQALRTTWVWLKFRADICRRYSWRPRWREQGEGWELITAGATVLPIPKCHDDICADLPGIGSFAKERILVVADADRQVEGLFSGATPKWSEASALELLSIVPTNVPLRDELAAWLSDVLDFIFDDDALTPAVRQKIAGLALLPVTDLRSKHRSRVTPAEWEEMIAEDRLVEGGGDWLHLLAAALPNWSCALASLRETPRWHAVPRPPQCEHVKSAEFVLKQERLGTFEARAKLVHAFLRFPDLPKQVRLAIRFLLHRTPKHAGNESSELFMPSPQHGQLLWSRFIRELLRHQEDDQSWRCLGGEWATQFSAQHLDALNVSFISSDGAAKELLSGRVEIAALTFAPEEWSRAEVAELIGGVYVAGRSSGAAVTKVLRRLRIHTPVTDVSARITISDADGQLRPDHALDSPGFARAIPPPLCPLWQRFLSSTTVIACFSKDEFALASNAQQALFRSDDAPEDEAPAILDWNYVVRRCLAKSVSSEWAELILEALSQAGDQAAANQGSALKSRPWLPMDSGRGIPPASVLDLPGLDDEVHNLVHFEQDGIASIRAVASWVRTHKGYSTLRKYLPGLREVLASLGRWLEAHPAWHLGLVESALPVDRLQFIGEVESLEDIKGGVLLAKFSRAESQTNNPEWEQLLRGTIWPAVLRPFGREGGACPRLESVLIRLGEFGRRSAFNAYLLQAVSECLAFVMLPKLRLINQDGLWLPANKLVWPSDGIDPAAQLNAEQAEILAPIHNPVVDSEPDSSIGAASSRHQLTAEPDFDAEIEAFKSYIQPFRNSTISEVLPASLAAVLGNRPSMVKLLDDLLESSVGLPSHLFAPLLVGEDQRDLLQSMRETRFVFEFISGKATDAETITGERIRVPLTQNITTLCVGDPADLKRVHYFQNKFTTGCRFLRLRVVEQPNRMSDPVRTFASTVETILVYAHLGGNRSYCPKNIAGKLADLAKERQTDLQRSQLYMLDIAEARLHELGVKGVAELEKIMGMFDDARRARIDARVARTHAPQIADRRSGAATQLAQEARQQLATLLERAHGSGARAVLVEAVRRKMTDFQYSLNSVALELFQNADDAAAELGEAKGALDTSERQFVFNFDAAARRITFAHWGRPINRHTYPGFSDGTQRGYDQDLPKMLTLNFSDKGTQDGSRPNIVTGRFGLGFKTVFFVSDKPEVISGKLAFDVRGGFYPVALSAEQTEDLKRWAEQFARPGAEPTVIRLPWTGSVEVTAVEAAFRRFATLAPLLSVFSREIRTIILASADERHVVSCVEHQLGGDGRLARIQTLGKSYLCFRCPLPNQSRPAEILFQLGPDGTEPLAPDLPRLWITTPTAERSDFGWAVNAPLKPDAGRQRLAINNPANREIAATIAARWGEALVALFDLSKSDWQVFARELQLRHTATLGGWWRVIWEQMTGTAPSDWQTLRDGGEVMGWMAWAPPHGAMRTFIQARPAIPTCLPGVYDQLVKYDDVCFAVRGLLADKANGSFELVANWTSVAHAFPPGKTVRHDVADYLHSVLGDGRTPAASVSLREVVMAEIGSRCEVSHGAGDRIGRLFRECEPLFAASARDSFEAGQLQPSLTRAKFCAEDGSYQPVGGLVCGKRIHDLIDKDEALRAGFAPRSAVVSAAYSDDALRFFARCRGKLSVNAVQLEVWAREAGPEHLHDVFVYLSTGDLALEVAGKLGADWFEQHRDSHAFKALNADQQRELEWKFSRRGPVPPPPDDTTVQPLAVVMPPNEALVRVSDWWNSESQQWTDYYEKKTYPHGFPGSLPWVGDDEWDAADMPPAQVRWLLLFIHAALVPLGFNKIGRDQGFTSFLVSRGWLNVLAEVSERPEALLRTLDDYLYGSIQNTAYHFAFRQFVAFYAVARNQEAFLHGLHAAERSDNPVAFSMVFNPNANPQLIGTGISAPPLGGLLGMGTCQLLRELYRVGRLTNPHGHQFAFTPIRKVRRLCAQLFGTSEQSMGAQSSQIIYSRIAELAKPEGIDPTFGCCFDLPLQILAENPQLRTRVLDCEFEAEAEDSCELDSAPGEFRL